MRCALLFQFVSINTSHFRVQNNRYAYSICMVDFDYVRQARNWRFPGIVMCCGQLYWKRFINCRHKINGVNIHNITGWFKEETPFEINYFQYRGGKDWSPEVTQETAGFRRCMTKPVSFLHCFSKVRKHQFTYSYSWVFVYNYTSICTGEPTVNACKTETM